MTYPLIAIGLTIVFALYVLYLLLIRKDGKKLRPVLFFGFCFIALWVVLYYWALK